MPQKLADGCSTLKYHTLPVLVERICLGRPDHELQTPARARTGKWGVVHCQREQQLARAFAGCIYTWNKAASRAGERWIRWHSGFGNPWLDGILGAKVGGGRIGTAHALAQRLLIASQHA